jgi:hypothetical protein
MLAAMLAANEFEVFSRLGADTASCEAGCAGVGFAASGAGASSRAGAAATGDEGRLGAVTDVCVSLVEDDDDRELDEKVLVEGDATLACEVMAATARGVPKPGPPSAPSSFR